MALSIKPPRRRKITTGHKVKKSSRKGLYKKSPALGRGSVTATRGSAKSMGESSTVPVGKSLLANSWHGEMVN